MRNWLSEVANLAAGEVAKLLSDSVTTADKEIASVKGEEKDLGVTTIRIGITIESRQVYCLVNVRNNLQTIRDGVSVPLNGDPMVLVSGIGTKAAELISFLKAAPNGYQI
jgi:hypothetical protein